MKPKQSGKLENHPAYSSALRNLKFLSIFSPEPLTVELPDKTVHSVGVGYGFISSTVWQRATNCLLSCRGACCTSWPRAGIGPLWHGGEEKPDNLDEYTVEVDGKPFVFYKELELGEKKTCTFYDTESGLCGIHSKGKPVHCDIVPQMGIYPLRGKLALYRRLPPRNWRFPKCPVDMATTKASKESMEELARIFNVYRHSADVIDRPDLADNITAVMSRLENIITQNSDTLCIKDVLKSKGGFF